MSRWTETRDTLQAFTTRTVSTARAEWSAAPAIPRAIWVALPIVAVLVLARLAWREPDDGLPPLPVLLVTAVVAATAVSARAFAGAWPGTSPARTVWPSLMTLAPQLLLAIACLPHVSAFTAGGLLAILFLSTSLTSAWDLLATPLPGEYSTQSRDDRDGQAILAVPTIVATEDAPEDGLGATQQQWFHRSTPTPGHEVLEGRVRVRFAPGEKLAAVHVPISPPLDAVPHIDCEVTADSDIRATVTARYPYGFRAELRRSDATAEETCELTFIATIGE